MSDDDFSHLDTRLTRVATSSIVVEFAKESRPRRERENFDADRAPRARRPPGHRVIVSGISRDTSWQVWTPTLANLCCYLERYLSSPKPELFDLFTT